MVSQLPNSATPRNSCDDDDNITKAEATLSAYYVKYYPIINSFSFHSNITLHYYSYPCFTDEEIETVRG